MTQHKVTEEMIDRAVRAATHPYLDDNRSGTRAYIRAALEAALNPDQPEDIPVSEAMTQVGLLMWSERPEGFKFSGLSHELMAATYRAMRRVEMREVQEQRLTPRGESRTETPLCIPGSTWRAHWRSGEIQPSAILCTHRRKDDAK